MFIEQQTGLSHKSEGVVDFEKLTGIDCTPFETFSMIKGDKDPFDADGWLLATYVARKTKINPRNYLISKEGVKRIEWLQKMTGIKKLVRTQTRATWLHPYLAYWFLKHVGVDRNTKKLFDRVKDECAKLSRPVQTKKPTLASKEPTLATPTTSPSKKPTTPLSFTRAAKHLGIDRSDLIQWLEKHGYIHKKPFENQYGSFQLWYGTEWAIDEGILVLIDGNKGTVHFHQTRITPDGYWKILEKITQPHTSL